MDLVMASKKFQPQKLAKYRLDNSTWFNNIHCSRIHILYQTKTLTQHKITVLNFLHSHTKSVYSYNYFNFPVGSLSEVKINSEHTWNKERNLYIFYETNINQLKVIQR